VLMKGVRRRLGFGLAVILTLACGVSSNNSSGSNTDQTGAPTQAPAPAQSTAQAAVRPPTALASPATGAALLDSVSLSLQANCRRGGAAAEISVSFSVRAVGGALTRVLLLDSRQVVHDSGPISQAIYEQSLIFPGGGGSHTYEVVVEPLARSTSGSRSTLAC
jgi:hypothetical protein